jgi:hypothetical protein
MATVSLLATPDGAIGFLPHRLLTEMLEVRIFPGEPKFRFQPFEIFQSIRLVIEWLL